MAEVKIQALKNGPLIVSGSVEILDSQGVVMRTGTDLALCRCGQSADKPFCDGSHKRVNFQSTVTAAAPSKV